jgi:hypothetical protein
VAAFAPGEADAGAGVCARRAGAVSAPAPSSAAERRKWRREVVMDK